MTAILSPGSRVIINALRNDPYTLMASAIQNNPEAIHQNIAIHFNTHVVTGDYQDNMAVIEEILKSDPENAENNLRLILSAPIIPERLTEEANHAIFSSPQMQQAMGNQETLNTPNTGEWILPFSNVQPLDDYGLPGGWDVGLPGTGPEPGSGDVGLPNDWQVDNGPTFDWAGFATGMIPSILDIFGVTNSNPGGQGPSNNNYYYGGGQSEEALATAKRTQNIVIYSIAGLAVVVALVFLVKALNK